MSAPSPIYWGSLPPLVPRRNSVRRSSGEISNDDQMNSKRGSDSQRISVSTMDSNSNVASPTDSYFPLAPPSFHKEQPKRRRQRGSQDSEKLQVGQAGSAADDEAHAPPPLSYKPPNNKESTTSQIPTRSRSTRRADEPVEVRRSKRASTRKQDRHSSKGATAEKEVIEDIPKERPIAEKEDIKDIPKGNTFPRRSHKVSRSDHPIFDDFTEARREHRTTSNPLSDPATAAKIDAKLRREWAPDRSPLQRLELALSSLTKEEKLTRAEQEEILAQGRPQRTASASGRATTKPATSKSFEPAPPRRETAGAHRNRQKAGSQQGSEGEQDMPSRGASFRERSALALGSRAATGAMVAGDGSLDRSSSKRLRKEPPGDPWYSRRNDAERSYRDAKPKGNPIDPQDTTPEDSTEEEVPVYKSLSRKIQQLTGISTSSTNRNVASKRLNDQEIASERSDESSSTEELQEGNNSRPHHHHLSEFIPGHHARDGYTPGQGLYLPPEPLKDWRQGLTGFLSAAYTDLDAKQTEAEKNKAWWEAEDSGKLRSRPPRTRIDRRFDGEAEESNGRVFPDFSVLGDGPVTGHDSIKGLPQIQDPAIAPVREYIGHEGTEKRNESWGKNPSELPSKSGRTPQGIKSPYSSKCPNPSEHNILYPSHICPSKVNNELTTSTRSIRVRPITVPTTFTPALYLKCGPLLRYKGIRREPDNSSAARKKGIREREIWRGSVLIVTTDEHSDYVTPPTLRLFSQPIHLPPPPPVQVDGPIAPEHVDPIVGLPKIARDGSTLYVRPVEDLDFGVDLSRDESDTGLFEKQRSGSLPKGGLDGSKDTKGSDGGAGKRDGERVGKYLEVPAVKLDVEQGVTFWRFNIEVELASHPQRIAYRINRGPATGFWVPSRGEAMNIMFYSCNGFTYTVDPEPFSGPDPLWRDVLNSHQTRPFHCMIGGGDQLYNDLVMTETEHFRDWLALKNPLIKHNAPFTPEMQLELETFYLNRYCMWFSQGLFGLANSQIPMINIFDDHDIIDGFGSYPDSFMGSPVFMGLGAIAYRFYLLFQHHTIVDEGEETEPSWIIGAEPGPWMGEHSRSVYLSLGKSISFLGLDCRTERKRDEIVTMETYDKVFDRCRREIISGETKHLILLLGVPIAYPRLVWLENILTSRLLDPIRAAGRMGFFKDLINEFDGGVEILDDLDDHWCAKHHKAERSWLIEELQILAAEKSVRVTILGGDVHLGAIGRFYSNPSLNIPKDRDFRYMPNVISSAIVNEPPPEMMADMMNKRNKIHHLNRDTDESMVPIFTHDVDNKRRNNKCLLPRRNWCSINLYSPGNSPPPTPLSAFDGNDRRTPSPLLQDDSVRRRHTRVPSYADATNQPDDSVRRRHNKVPSYADATKRPDDSMRRRHTRGPSYTPDATNRPPLSGAGSLLRRLSGTRGRSSSDGNRPSVLTRTLSLTRRDLTPRNLFRRNSSKRRPDDGGINGYGASESESESENEPSLLTDSQTSITNSNDFSTSRRHHENNRSDRNANNSDVQLHVRGGAGGDEDQDRPLFRSAPTELSRKGPHQQSINLEGGLEITLNFEREKGDPAGITVPYQFIVPALWYDVEEEGMGGRRPSRLERLRSLGKGRGAVFDR